MGANAVWYFDHLIQIPLFLLSSAMGIEWVDVVADVIVMLVASAMFAFAVAACVFFVSIFMDALFKIATTRTLDPLFTLVVSLLLATLSGLVACIAVFTVKKAGE